MQPGRVVDGGRDESESDNEKMCKSITMICPTQSKISDRDDDDDDIDNVVRVSTDRQIGTDMIAHFVSCHHSTCHVVALHFISSQSNQQDDAPIDIPLETPHMYIRTHTPCRDHRALVFEWRCCPV